MGSGRPVGEHRSTGGEPMQTLRASLVAVPFVILAALVAALSLIIGPAQ